MKETKKVHALVLAMSDLYRFEKSYYQFAPSSAEASRVYEGIGQLEVIPQFIQDYHKTDITHMIILETAKTKEHLEDKFVEKMKSLLKSEDKTVIHFRDKEEEQKFYNEVTAVSFFKKRMEFLNITPIYKEINIEEDHPEKGLKDLLDYLRKIYAECEENEGDWKLWLDSHGGFRDIAMALDTLLQVLSTTDISGYPRLQDGQRIIGVNGVYSIKYNQNSTQDNPSIIIDRTDFYKEFTTPALKAYMNYGQYLQNALRPCEGDHEYAFISYKHDEADKERIMFMSLLKKADYRYWYDDGIHIGANWKDVLEQWQSSEKNILFIALLSKSYLTSVQCLKELKAAIKRKKRIILVSLDRTPLYFNEGLKASNENETVEILPEELDGLPDAQHISLQCYLLNDVLQEDWLMKKLMNAAYEELELIKGNRFETVTRKPDESITDCFVNFSNHPFEKWDTAQRSEAEKIGPIVNVPFPAVDPESDEEALADLAQKQMDLILSYHPKAVMCQGEFTLCNLIIRQLQRAGIDVYAACSERQSREYIDETGKTVRSLVFKFVRFRKYAEL